MDRVFIERLSVSGKHGVHPREREVAQEFLIDIRAECDTRKAAGTDDIADTVDYSDFRRIAKEVVEQSSFNLMERILETIARRILEDSRISAVELTIRKAKIYPDTVPGISIRRQRA